MKKNIVFAVLALLLAAMAFAQTEADFTVELTKDGEGVIVKKYTGNAKAVRIPASIQGMPVREITYAFDHNKTITSVVIPEGVTYINAFSICSNLTSVNFPKTLTMISGFRETKLTAVDLSGTSIGRIGFTAFKNCTALTSIALPDSITSISYDAFWGCSALTAIAIPETVEKIEFGNNVFKGCSKLPLATQAKLKELGYTGSF
jgi:hypothetical protein